jgi:hypothetical protein
MNGELIVGAALVAALGQPQGWPYGVNANWVSLGRKAETKNPDCAERSSAVVASPGFAATDSQSFALRNPGSFRGKTEN